MRDKFNRFFNGRCGMDELNKVLILTGLVGILLSGLCGNALRGVPAFLANWVGLLGLLYFVLRFFSKDMYKRTQENNAYLALLRKRKEERAAAKERRSQRKDFCFFKCPGCKRYLRVPKGKGKIHISCKCGYVLYRKT